MPLSALGLNSAKKGLNPIKWNRPSLSKKELESVLNCLIDDEIAYGKIVDRFEKEFAKNFNFRHALAVNSLTSAYHLAFLGLDLFAGDQIICSTLSPLEIWDAASYLDLDMIAVDTDVKSFHPSVDKIFQKLTPQTRVIIIEHKFGSYFSLIQELKDRLHEVRHNGERIYIIEDYSANIGQEVDVDYAGHLGSIGIVSLADDMILTTGQGAMLTLSDSKIYGKINKLRSKLNRPDNELRYDYNINDIQAAIGLEQLDHLPLLIERRRKIGSQFLEILAKTKFESYFNNPLYDTFLNFPVLTQVPMEKMERHFKAMQIEIARICQKPLHHHLIMDKREYPNAEKLWMQAIRLPCYPHLSKNNLERIEIALKSLY
jgi:dTDP-4-amino-4,6-dideoxygalactose transaminase